MSETNIRYGNLSRAIRQAFPLGGERQGILILNASRNKASNDTSAGSVSRRRASLGLSPGVLSFPSSLATGGADIPRRYTFQRTLASQEEFALWIDELIAAELLQPTIPLEQKWLVSKLAVAYSGGATTARNKAAKFASKLGVELPSNSPFLNRNHVDRSRLIYERNFNSFKGLTDSMKGELRRTLSDGVIKGKSPYDIGRDLDARIKVGRARSNRLARTEIINAHQEASLKETEILEAELGVEFDMEWSTTKDGRQRDSHEHRDGKIYTKDQVRALIGEPNCRCAVFPFIEFEALKNK